MVTKNMYEVFDEFEKRTTRDDKVAVLRFNGTWALRNVLKGTFDPEVQFVIEKAPTYRASDAPIGLGYTSIHQELGRTYLFEKNSPKVNPAMTQDRKEQILIQILEALEKREADIFMGMILKKQKVKGLTYSIVKEAFPDLLP
jgi:hypothetical protein